MAKINLSDLMDGPLLPLHHMQMYILLYYAYGTLFIRDVRQRTASTHAPPYVGINGRYASYNNPPSSVIIIVMELHQCTVHLYACTAHTYIYIYIAISFQAIPPLCARGTMCVPPLAFANSVSLPKMTVNGKY